MIDATRFEPGDRFGDLRIERELGRGAFGRVYLAVDTLIGREVALKVVPAPSGEEDDEQRRRALREARAVGRLNSPHIVTLYRVHAPNERKAWIFEMEYVEGGTLTRLLEKERSLPPKHVMEVARGIASALRVAHEEGVVHGDVKPGNVLLTKDGTVKMADFGLSRIRGDISLSISTTGGKLVGTPIYVAPEVVMGDRATAASDIWALGVVLYRLVSGRLPFQANNLNVLFFEIQNSSPPPLDDSVPLPLAELALHCLAKLPADRPHSCASILSRLEESWAGRITAPAAPPPLVTPRARLLGRERETAKLVTLLNQAERGEGAVALLSGEAGMGKSALARNAVAIAKARGFHAIEATVSALEGLLRPLLEVSRSMMQAEEMSAPDSVLFGSAATVVQKLLDEEEGPRLEGRAQTVWALEQLLRGFAKRQKLALLVEDAQNADSEDVRLLKHLVRYLPQSGVFLLVTCQPRATDRADETANIHELASMEDVTHLELTALSREDAFRLLEDRAGGLRVEPEVADRVLSVAQGNPLYLVELLRHLDETGAIVREKGMLKPGPTWKAETLPRRFHELAIRRLEGLTEEDRLLLDVAAVDGLDFDGEAIAAVTGQLLLLVLRTLQRIYRERGIIMPSANGYRFANAVFQRVIYEDLAPELRKQLHLQLAQHLSTREQGVRPERIGVHWEMAGHKDRAAPHLLKASRAAYARQDWLRSIDWANRAGLGPERASLENFEATLELAASYYNTGRAAEAETLLAELMNAAAEAKDDTLRLRAAVRLAAVQYSTKGKDAIDEAELRHASETLPESVELGRARNLLGLIAKYRADLGAAQGWFESAGEVFRRLKLDSQYAAVVHQLAAVAFRDGRLREAEALYNDAARISSHLGQRSNAAATAVNRDMVAQDLGRMDGLEASLVSSIRTLTIEGARNMAAHAGVVLAQVRYALGNRSGAESALQDSLATLEETRYLPGLVFARLEQAHLVATGGDLQAAHALLDEAEALAKKSGDLPSRVSAKALRCQMLCWAQDIDGAAALAESCLAEAGKHGQDSERGTWALQVAECVLYGIPSRIAELAAELLPDGKAPDDRLVALRGAVDGFRAYAEQDAAEALDAGARALRGENMGHRRAKMRILGACLAAEALRRQGDRDAARGEFSGALETARSLGHVWLEAKLSSLLARLKR